MAPYQTFRTRDGWINIGAANQANWERLIEALGADELGRDPRFINNSNRMRNLQALVELLTPYFLKRTTAEWLKVFEDIDFPAGPLLSIAEMLTNPQTQAREMVVEVNHSKLGYLKTLGIPVKFSKTRGSVRRSAPMLGEHTREILLEHGFRSKEIDQLIAAGVIRAD
jgi:crotonobetainyl-CoA:carnitine CoA-transferase CaiB-like acyl-CoA transferase